jgi:hypothetical protein
MTGGTTHDPRVATLALVDRLIRQGRGLHDEAGIRIWQRDCAEAVHELSGGSKAHWLSRAYSGALLVRSTDGGAVVEATPAEIVARVVDVLERARASVSNADTTAPVEAPAPHRFDFVHDAALRPVLEQAFVDSARALDAGDFERSLKTSCGILEAIMTDALENARLRSRATPEEETGPEPNAAPGSSRATEVSFDERIQTAEQLGLIRGGCARLTPAARAYRDASSDAPISARDARIARQVLAVVMRDLDPGR